MWDKHYKGQGFRYSSASYTDKIVSVRLSDAEMRILKNKYPGMSLSFAIRSAIHELERNPGKM